MTRSKSKDLVNYTQEDIFRVIFHLTIFAIFVVVTTMLMSLWGILASLHRRLTSFLVFAIVAISVHDTYLYQFDSNVNRVFLKRETGDLYYSSGFQKLVTTAEWYDYLTSIFLKYWHNEDIGTDEGRELKTRVFFKENLHIGVARLRQIRVKPNSCIIHEIFNRYFNTCYSRYYEELEETKEVYKISKYNKFKDFPVEEVKGLITNYRGPGYVVYLTGKYKENQNIVKSLKQIRWVDRATRLLAIEFVVYNPNTNTLVNIRLKTEVLATGTILSTYKVKFLPIYSIWSKAKPTSLILSSMFLAMILYYTAEEFWYFNFYGFYYYMKGKWNLLDFGILISAYVALTLAIIHPFRISKRLNTILTNKNHDIFIDDLCYWHFIFKLFLSICAIFVWLKILRFLSFNVTMSHFSMAIQRSSKNIMGFAVMFFIVFIAYALLGVLLFSDINPAFSSFPNAVVTMMRMIMGDYQYQKIEKAESILGPIFFISYILFIFFILLNMFLAVISDSYVTVKESVKYDVRDKRKVQFKIWYNIRKCFKRCCKRKPKSSADSTDFTSDSDGPRALSQDVALKEFYGSTRSSLDDLEETDDQTRPKNITDLERLSLRLEGFEFDLEGLISKMDRVLQKLDAHEKEKGTHHRGQ